MRAVLARGIADGEIHLKDSTRVTESKRAQTVADVGVRRLTLSLSGQPPAQRAETNKELVEKREEATELRRQEQAMSTQLTKFQQAIAGEQTRRNELSAHYQPPGKGIGWPQSYLHGHSGLSRASSRHSRRQGAFAKQRG